MMYPQIERIIEFPAVFPTLGFVLSTNGTLRPDLDSAIAKHRWLVAVSLHGRRETHNAYTKSKSFDQVVERIGTLTQQNIVHIYCVLHETQTRDDLAWLQEFRDESRASFLRFIVPRSFGRYRLVADDRIIEYAKSLVDSKTVLKTSASLTRFRSAAGIQRMTA